MEILAENVLRAPQTIARVAPSPRPVAPQTLSHSTWATWCSFLLVDVVAFTVVVAILSYVPAWEHQAWLESGAIVPVIGVLMSAYAVSGLYNPIAVHPAQELRLVSMISTVVFAVYAFAIGVVSAGSPGVLLGLLLAWAVTLTVVLSFRALARVVLAKASWWGVPVVILASNGAGSTVVDTLMRWPEIGLRPVALLHDDISDDNIDKSLALEMTRLAPLFATTHKIPYVIIAMPDLDERRMVDLVGRSSKFFQHVLVVPEVTSSPLWTSRQAVAGLMGYGVRHAARSRIGQLMKRSIDIAVASVGLVVLSPLFLLVAILIKLEAPGPVFFKQVRMGREGRCFLVMKFRSMHLDADERLHDLLAEDPAMREEYERYHKLQSDPRITSVGRVLRRYSLDELPQLWNVLRGDMSLVGPRAYIPGELKNMRGFDRVVLQNRPGITGLWQVSGRNQLRFEERVRMDVHYVQNWTPWLDLYIAARTVPVVMLAEGAS